ncbi:MAG: ParA family protein [Candidatus Nanosyncoccaceae bacterium]|jgi:chromosome partitioning protein
MATVIAVTNQKGGVGKTTTAVNLAYYLARLGKKTLLIDFDPQGNTTSGFGANKSEMTLTVSDVLLGKASLMEVVIETPYKNLFLTPAVSTLANTEAELNQAERRFGRLRRAVTDMEAEFDFVLIDCPPSLSLLTVNALIASDYVILPVQTEFYALEGLSQLLETMKIIRGGMNPDLQLLGVLPTMVDSRTALSGQVLLEIKRFFKNRVFESVIPRNVRLAEAPSHGVPIGEYDRFSKGARAYKALAKEVIKRVG